MAIGQAGCLGNECVTSSFPKMGWLYRFLVFCTFWNCLRNPRKSKIWSKCVNWQIIFHHFKSRFFLVPKLFVPICRLCRFWGSQIDFPRFWGRYLDSFMSLNIIFKFYNFLAQFCQLNSLHVLLTTDSNPSINDSVTAVLLCLLRRRAINRASMTVLTEMPSEPCSINEVVYTTYLRSYSTTYLRS